MTEHQRSRTIGGPVADLVGETPATPSKARLMRATGAAAAAVLVAAGGAFAGGQLSSAANAAGGASSPEAAVEAMFTSLEQNDVIGVVDHLAPGEREVLRDAADDYVRELKRLGVLSGELDLNNVEGFELSFDDMTFDVEPANARVSLVEITGGQVTVGVNAADLPVGKMIVDRLGPLPQVTETETIDLADELSGVDDVPRIAVIEESGRYYVSSFYTVAETLAAESGYELPDTPIPAAGAATPEDAVHQLVEASVDLDLARVIELTPPDEMAALHDYGPILVQLAEEAIADGGVDAELEAFTIRIDGLEFETVGVSGGTKVLPTHIAFSVESNEGDLTFSATKVDQTCVEYEFTATLVNARGDAVTEDDAGRYCAADIYDVLADADVPLEVQQIAERMLAQLGQVGIVTVEVDGEWYVSPARSGTDLLLVALQGLQRGDFETLLDYTESWCSFD